jgi:hypothetical protein
MRAKKGVPHADLDALPRRRDNEASGYGRSDNDRPPICGVHRRASSQGRLPVAAHSDGAVLEKLA